MSTNTQQKVSVAQKQSVMSTTSLPVKQTIKFKNKQQQQQVVQKKNLNKVMGLSSKPSSPNLSSVAHKLNSSGVTISKPTTNTTTQASKPSPSIPKPQARNSPSPVVRSNIPQGISITKQPKNQNLAKKFPHLNITNVEESPSTTLQPKPGVSTKPNLTVNPSSQLLKPHVSLDNLVESKGSDEVKFEILVKLEDGGEQKEILLTVPAT